MVAVPYDITRPAGNGRRPNIPTPAVPIRNRLSFSE